MKDRFHSLLCCVCLAVLSACCLAQQSPGTADAPSEKTIEGWLLSGEPRLVAWGAHDALAARDQYLVPDLLSLASRWQPLTSTTPDSPKREPLSQEQLDERDAMAAVLDALIQMKAPVPAETLGNLAPDFGDAVAVLLTRIPADDAGPLAYDFYRHPADHGLGLQAVSAALLALNPVQGFAAALLTDITVRGKVRVVLPGAGEVGGGTGYGYSCGLSGETLRTDWPVTGQYALTKQKSADARLLVAGLDPIYVTRDHSTHYLGNECGRSRDVYLSADERRRLIAEMLGISPLAIPWQTDAVGVIEFQSLEQFDQSLREFIEIQQQEFRTTLAALEARGLITSSEAENSLPELDLKLEDTRGRDAIAIPNPANLPPDVKWSPSPFH